MKRAGIYYVHDLRGASPHERGETPFGQMWRQAHQVQSLWRKVSLLLLIPLLYSSLSRFLFWVLSNGFIDWFSLVCRISRGDNYTIKRHQRSEQCKYAYA